MVESHGEIASFELLGRKKAILGHCQSIPFPEQRHGMHIGLPGSSLQNTRQNIELSTHALSGIAIIFILDKGPKYRTPGNPKYTQAHDSSALCLSAERPVPDDRRQRGRMSEVSHRR